MISKQLLRSATSIGANVYEAQNAESRKDFIHKMKIALKEAEESYYWLILCCKSKNYPDCSQHLSDLKSIIRILAKIVSSSIKNLKSSLSAE